MSTVSLEFNVTRVPEETFAYVVRSVAPGEAAEFIRGAIERVYAFAVAHGGPQGPPMTLASAPDEHGRHVFEAGWTVPAGTVAEPPVEIRTLPATAALVHRHVGPYDELAALYPKLFAEAQAQGYTLASMPRERYLTGPGDGPPVTEIVWPLSSS